MITLIVKGGQEAAIAAARARKIPIAIDREVSRPRLAMETIATTADSYFGAVANWYNEDVGKRPPYAAGCLLYFNGR